MSLNRTITDLKVKQLIVEWRTANRWGQSGMPIFRTGVDYRLSLVFGNTAGRISWEGDRYDKENIRIQLEPLGIRTSSGIILKNALRYFDNASFSGPVRQRPPKLEIAGPFKTTHADLLKYLYFRARPQIADYPLNRFRFSAFINAAIRNHRSHQVITEV